MNSNSLNLQPADVSDYRDLAQKKLPRQFFDYIDGASYQELTATHNCKAFQQIQLRQRILKDISRIDTKSELLGEKLDLPIILGPVGLAGCFARRGEAQALRAASKANIPFCLSTVSICSIEELHATQHTSFWFQLYVIKDKTYAIKLLQRARDAGCTKLVFTVDLPVVGDRLRDIRNGLSGTIGLKGKLKRVADILAHPSWVWDVPVKGRPLLFGNLSEAVPNARELEDFKGWVDQQFDPSITWEDLNWLRDHWEGEIIIKGILDTEDAKMAIKIGADAIVVSNHGGRQLDSAPASIEVLPDLAKTVDGRCKVLIDGGIRSGTDVVKALALGADACLLGRAWAYALAARGEQGVSHLLSNFEKEMRVTMALTGCQNLKEINRTILHG